MMVGCTSAQATLDQCAVVAAAGCGVRRPAVVTGLVAAVAQSAAQLHCCVQGQCVYIYTSVCTYTHHPRQHTLSRRSQTVTRSAMGSPIGLSSIVCHEEQKRVGGWQAPSAVSHGGAPFTTTTKPPHAIDTPSLHPQSSAAAHAGHHNCCSSLFVAHTPRPHTPMMDQGHSHLA
jgi:hypothetical protein